jgi:ubiquinone/menaquinone biosynthesis C-methylase UbiE
MDRSSEVAVNVQAVICCPTCFTKLKKQGASFMCSKCKTSYPIIQNKIISFLDTSNKISVTKEKWESFYSDDEFNKKAEEEYRKYFLKDINRQVLRYFSGSAKGKIFLDAGCGYGITGEELSKKGWFFIGLDYSMQVLLNLNKRLVEHGVKNYLLLHADILSLPIRSDTVDLVWSGGVFEHIKDYQAGLDNIYKCLKPGGYSNLAVPSFNIGNLVYRSQWGSIPNIPILKQIAEFMHIKLLKGKHMVFGYELQFTKSQIMKIHINAGFKKDKIIIGRLECMPQIHCIKTPRLKSFFRHLCETNENFWPMVVTVGFKS